jgi:predicted DNA-binding transcriptional regulator YafY
MAIQAKPGITAKELAERCETTERTIYRDLSILDLIVPITNEGYGKGYTFAGNFAMYPMNFTEQESLVFSMLPSVIDTNKLPPGFESAYDKVMATLVKEKARNHDIVKSVSELIQMGSPAYKEDSQNFLFPIIQATLAQKTINTVYHTQSKNEITEREIDPYYLIPREQRFYLIGFCHKAQEVRTFRISRFRNVEILDRHFDKGDFSIKQYMKNTWSIERKGDALIHFKVRFSANVARYVKEEELFVRPRMTDLKDGSLLFEVSLNHDREFLKWVFSYGPEAEILEPSSYRKMMKAELERWKLLYK